MFVLAAAFFLCTSLPAQQPEQTNSPERQWGPITEGFQLSARLEKDEVGVCEPIVLELHIRNASAEVLLLDDILPEMDYEMTIEDEQGNIMPLTSYGRRIMSNKEEMGSKVLKFKPWEEQRCSVLVNRIYDMTFSGTYAIAVKRGGIIKEGRVITAKVVSNTVSVKIVDLSVNTRIGPKGPDNEQGNTHPKIIPREREWGPIIQGFQLSARLEKDTVGIGEPIVLELFLRNTSREVLLLGHFGLDYEITIADEQGNSVPLTEYGTRIKSAQKEIGVSLRKLGPGGEEQASIRVNDIYDMTLVGIYYITVERGGLFKQDGKPINAKVVSNTVKVKITDSSNSSGTKQQPKPEDKKQGTGKQQEQGREEKPASNVLWQQKSLRESHNWLLPGLIIAVAVLAGLLILLFLLWIHSRKRLRTRR
jgi:hypothetical protein